MTTNELHPGKEELLTFARGKVEGVELIAIATHLAACKQCQKTAGESLPLETAARALVVSMISREAPEDAVAPRAGVEWWRFVAAAAAVLAAVAMLLLFRDNRPVPAAHRPAAPVISRVAAARPARDADIDAALAAGLTPPARWTMLPHGRGSLRGATSGPSPVRVLAPYGEVVEESRPTLSWTPAPHASYNVSVIDGRTIVTSSRPISATRWEADRELVRGRTYTWQVEVTTGSSVRIVPAPPDPPARFTVLDEASLGRLNAARRATPDDHLAIGLAAAKQGLRQTADEEFSRVPATSADYAAAQRFRTDLRTWSR
ncbi:MAG: hypothetical protein QOC81_1946 [Thermoanaerobaculia bacterium]|nr:hypothetical protein [Thermoanaerobaculia bacterium]